MDSESESVEVLDDEHGHLHDDPRIPSRPGLDALYQQGEARGWTEHSARAWEYLAGRREIADERVAALARGDTETVAALDRRHALMDQNYTVLAQRERALDTPELATHESSPAEGSPVVVVAHDPHRQRPSVPDDLAALRSRIAALAAHRERREATASSEGSQGPGGEPREPGAVARSTRPLTPHPHGSDERRAQLARWADDDTRANSAAGDEDGA